MGAGQNFTVPNAAVNSRCECCPVPRHFSAAPDNPFGAGLLERWRVPFTMALFPGTAVVKAFHPTALWEKALRGRAEPAAMAPLMLHLLFSVNNYFTILTFCNHES